MKVSKSLLGVLTVLSVACGSKPPPKVATTPPPPVVAKDVREPVVQHACGNRQKIAQLFGDSAHAAPTPASQAAEPVSEAPPPSTGEAAPGSTPMRGGTQAYRIVAPATVLIRSEHGIGTGVVVDPRGYILTNHHVVADGRKKDFIVNVDVSFGDLTATGRMAKREKALDAVVVKDDPVRDLALVKVIDPPKNLVAVKLAKSAPQIAERVMAIGHAGIGFLWAAKSCGVASIGERQIDTSMLAGFDCSHTDPSQSAAAAKREKEMCDAQKKSLTETFMAQTQGLAVQTDCAITHGDSGGPLVNSAGELVGLNQSLSVDAATVSFHVHVDEIRDFTAKFEEEPTPIVPDPYCDGGLDASLEDVDLDGKPDTLVTKGFGGFFGGMDRMSLLIDLDESKKPGKEGLDAFDVEIALLKLREATYVWYDTDKDNRLDVMLVDNDDDGEPEKAYHIDEKGRLKEDKEILPKHDLSAKFVKDASLHGRLGKIAAAIGGQRYTSTRVRTAAETGITLPDGLLGGGSTGRTVDSDGDGKSDSVFVRGAFSRGILIDANQDSLSSIKPGESADDLVKAKKVDAEMSVITQGDRLWALYDTNNDSTFDLALLGNAPTYGDTNVYAMSAWKVAANGEMTPAPENIGRKLFRPQLVGMPRVASALKLAGMDVAADDGLGSLPNPMDLGVRSTVRFREMKGLPKSSVIDIQNGATSVTLIDVDVNSKVGAKDEPRKVLSDKKFDAEIAVVQRNGNAWVFYDTDNDGKFDFVLFAEKTAKGPSQAFRATNAGAALETDDKSVAGRLFRHKTVFKDKVLGPKWKAIATKLYTSTSVEE